MRVDLSAAALEEAGFAAAFYEEQRTGWGTRFEEELAGAIERIAASPERWPVWPLRARGRTRRVLLKRFPCGVVYEIRDRAVVVVAVAHFGRRPGYWARSR